MAKDESRGRRWRIAAPGRFLPRRLCHPFAKETSVAPIAAALGVPRPRKVRGCYNRSMMIAGR
ncbi:MAG: hypothetical protein EOM24_24165 [Chloroflexia bacterium]|nr:hypothetical protein [Chloroflexia bacterium]